MNESAFFLPYQKKWILDNSRIKIMEKSRQIGMSWTTAYSLVRNHACSRFGRDSWVSSRDELQAKLFIQDCKKFANILNIAVSQTCKKSLTKNEDASSIEFADGTRIWSLSSNPDAQAGKRGTRVLDEFALHPDPEKLYAISLPGITWGGNLEIISTHRGKENFFNKLIEEVRFGDNPKKISLHTITLQDALEQGLLTKIKQSLPRDNQIHDMNEADYFDFIKNSCADNAMFMQEYMCQPASDDEKFLPYSLIQQCLYSDNNDDWHKISSKANALYLGVDIARTCDLSVFWLLEKSADVMYTRDVKTLKNATFAEQEAVLESYLKNPSLLRVCIDNSGIGRQFAERAVSRYGSSRIEAITFTQVSKELIAYPLKNLFEQVLLRIPNELEIIADLHKVRRCYSAHGHATFSSDRDSNGHSDRFWALALANYACKNAKQGHGYLIESLSNNEFMW